TGARKGVLYTVTSVSSTLSPPSLPPSLPCLFCCKWPVGGASARPSEYLRACHLSACTDGIQHLFRLNEQRPIGEHGRGNCCSLHGKFGNLFTRLTQLQDGDVAVFVGDVNLAIHDQGIAHLLRSGVMGPVMFAGASV